VSIDLIPSPYRRVFVQNTLAFRSYGWGTMSGELQIKDQEVLAGNGAAPAAVLKKISAVKPRSERTFETAVGISAIRLKNVRFTTYYRLTWNGVEIDLSATQVLNNTFIKQFYAVGPFGNGSFRRMTQIGFAPEREVFLAGTYTGKKARKISWQKIPWQAPVREHRGRDYRFVDLGRNLSRMAPAAGYVLAQVFVPEKTAANLLVGTEGGIIVWVNNVEVLRDSYMRYDRPDQVKVEIQLRRGWNKFLVKAVDEGRQWGFYLKLLGTDGRPIPGAVSGWGPGFTARP
jgi:hypothetical protein